MTPIREYKSSKKGTLKQMDGHTAVADRTSTIQPPNEEAEAKARKMAYAITFLDAMRVHSDNDKPLEATDQ